MTGTMTESMCPNPAAFSKAQHDRPSHPTQQTLLPSTLLASGMEVSVHRCHKLMLREVHHIFPHLKACVGDVLAVPTIQHSRMDIVRMGAEVEEEKDRCLETFAEFAAGVVAALEAEGHWADFIDPCSGLPMKTPGCTRPYSEVAGFEYFLRFKTQNAGCCKVLLHPRWGSACYPATLFTTAPFDKVRTALRAHEAPMQREPEAL